MQKIDLSEWETIEPSKDSPLAGADLAGNPAARKLAEKLTRSGQVEILELACGLELRASSFVGRFALADFVVTIKPKIPGIPLMNLLRYAYRLRNLKLFDEVDYKVTQSSFGDLLIHQLAAESQELINRGLHRDYLRLESTLASPRGRIGFTRYAPVAANAGAGLPCVHYPRSEDNCLNRILHGGLVLASKMTMDRELGCEIRRLAKSLVGRITPGRLDVAGFDEAWYSLDRRTGAYRPALTLIRMLLNTQGAALDDAKPDTAAAGFLFDMNRFFQALLSRFLSENLVGYEIQDERALRDLFSYDPANNPRNRRQPSLRPDFVVLHDRKIEATLDAKYRDLWERNLPREMLYQLALYALGQDSHNRRATILYPTLDDSARQQIVVFRDPLNRTAKAEIILRPVNLLWLDSLLSDEGKRARHLRADLAHQLVFGARLDPGTAP